MGRLFGVVRPLPTVDVHCRKTSGESAIQRIFVYGLGSPIVGVIPDPRTTVRRLTVRAVHVCKMKWNVCVCGSTVVGEMTSIDDCRWIWEWCIRACELFLSLEVAEDQILIEAWDLENERGDSPPPIFDGVIMDGHSILKRNYPAYLNALSVFRLVMNRRSLIGQWSFLLTC